MKPGRLNTDFVLAMESIRSELNTMARARLDLYGALDWRSATERDLAGAFDFQDELKRNFERMMNPYRNVVDGFAESLNKISYRQTLQDVFGDYHKQIGQLQHDLFRNVMSAADAVHITEEAVRREVERSLVSLPDISSLARRIAESRSGDGRLSQLEETDSQDSSPVPTIEMPPGFRMMAVASVLFNPRTVELIFEPIVADYRYEIFEAITANRSNGRLRVIRTQYWVGFIAAVALQILGGIGRLVKALKGAG